MVSQAVSSQLGTGTSRIDGVSAFGDALGSTLADRWAARAQTGASAARTGGSAESARTRGSASSRDERVAGAETFALGSPEAIGDAAQLEVGPLEILKPDEYGSTDIASVLRDQLSRLRASPGLGGSGFRSTYHNSLISHGEGLADLLDLLAGRRQLDVVMASAIAANDRNDEFVALRSAQLSSGEAANLGYVDLAERLHQGTLRSLVNTVLLAERSRAGLFSFDREMFNLQKAFGNNLDGMGTTSLASEAVGVFGSLPGIIASVGQGVALEADKTTLGHLHQIGLVSSRVYARSLVEISQLQNGAMVGGAASILPGPWGKAARFLDFASTSSSAEAAIGPKLSRAMSRQVNLGQYLSGELQSLFHLDRFARGQLFEDLRLQHIPANRRFGNYPAIDDFDDVTGRILSVKSVDLQAASRLDSARLDKLLRGYVDSVADFKGLPPRKVTVDGVPRDIWIKKTDIGHRQLDLGYEANVATAQQRSVLADLLAYGTARGVNINLVPIR